jgi:hypothetical protein
MEKTAQKIKKYRKQYNSPAGAIPQGCFLKRIMPM